MLANVDTELCEQVAAALNLPAPKGKPAEDVTVSPALVQILAEPGRVGGRKIGIIANAGSDLAGISKLVKAAAAVAVTALVIAPVGGVLKAGRRKVTVDPTLATARSIEFDAVVVAAGTTPTTDIKLVVLLQEAFRHCKAIAAWGDGATVLKAARIPTRGRALRWPTTSTRPSPQTWRRRWGCTVHGTEPRRSWPRRFPLPADPRGQATHQRSERPE